MMSTMTLDAEIQAGLPERIALRALQIGAIVVVLVASTLNVFDLDRFLVPKDLALHVTAFLVCLFSLRAIRRAPITRADRFLIAYIALGAISAALATNRWLGLRALAISASGVVLFWAARGLRQAGLARPMLNALALAIVAVAVTSLLQAYGLETRFFSFNRAPGGTLGNRNFVGHAAAFGLPLVLFAALRARRFSLGCAGVALVSATLVLTRSRAAWIACAGAVAIFVVALLASSSLRRDGRTWKRFTALVVVAAIAVGAAMFLPNALHWRAENPYLESMKGVVSYDEGSGRGRLVQYERSLRMAASHPLFGVGPGNWPVVYPQYVPRGDRSMNPSEPGTTFNPWPSSDWIAFIAERGLVAAVLLALAFFGIAASAFRQLVRRPWRPELMVRDRDVEDALLETTLLATLVAALLAGLFDAVLLLPLPTLLVWTTLGALWTAEESSSSARSRTGHGVAVVAVIALAAIGTFRSGSQLLAMEMYATNSDRPSLERASQIDPGNYRLHLRLARIERRRQQRCDHARFAHALFPNADAARALARGCGE
jgi:O-antigen ligase